MLGLMDNREQRLQAAGEIHRFHRDVAEALSRIQEKEAALPDDLGRDLNSVLALIRRHEGFENDLVALEAQLQVVCFMFQCRHILLSVSTFITDFQGIVVWQVLVEDAVRLEALYPGQNATHIAQQKNVVVSSWSVLQERSANRREELHASCELQRFLTQVCRCASRTEMCNKVLSVCTNAMFA